MVKWWVLICEFWNRIPGILLVSNIPASNIVAPLFLTYSYICLLVCFGGGGPREFFCPHAHLAMCLFSHLVKWCRSGHLATWRSRVLGSSWHLENLERLFDVTSRGIASPGVHSFQYWDMCAGCFCYAIFSCPTFRHGIFCDANIPCGTIDPFSHSNICLCEYLILHTFEFSCLTI